jgi:hypothetical protein
MPFRGILQGDMKAHALGALQVTDDVERDSSRTPRGLPQGAVPIGQHCATSQE